MGVEWIPVAVTGTSPLLVVLFTWLTRRGLDRRAAEAKTQVDTLTQQREDFKAIVEPLQDSVTSLRADNRALQDALDELTTSLRSAERREALLISAVDVLKTYIFHTYNDTGPRLDPRVNVLIESER